VSDYPLIKFTILFIAGILIKELFNVPLSSASIIFAVSTSVLLILFFVKRRLKNFRLQPLLLNLFTIISIFSTGILYSHLLNDMDVEYPLDRERIKDVIIEGELIGKELPKEKYFDFYIQCDRIIIGKDTLNEKSNFLCKIKRKSVNDIPFEIGSIIRVKGTIQKARDRRNPFEFDYNNYLKKKGISGLFYIASVSDLSIIIPAGFSVDNLIFTARISISKQIIRMYSFETASLLKGLLLADRSGIDPETKESFVNAGVIHVLAVSGLHVGYITIIFLFLFSRFNIYVKNILTLIGLLIFVLVTGAPASVVRASIMAGVLILSSFSIRSYSNINSLAIAALIILVFDPSELFDPGFQLSFSAVLAIFIIYPIIRDWIINLRIQNKYVRSTILFLGVSVAAQLGTLPFTLIYFNKFSLVSLVANLFVIPLIGIIVSLGITSLLFSPIWTFIGILYAGTTELTSDLLILIVKTIGKWDYSYLFIRQFSLYDGIVYYVTFGVLYYILKKFSSIIPKLIAVTLLIITSVFFVHLDNEDILPQNILSVVMIDVGQGDSFLIKFPNGQTALIDAGNATPSFDNGERVIYPLLQNLGITKIDYGFVSHVDSDHYRGFEFLVGQGLINTIYKPKCDSTKRLDVEFENLINESNTELKYYNKSVMHIGTVNIYILNEIDDTRLIRKSSNDMSGIIKVVYGSTEIMFVGDAGRQVESRLVKRYGKFLASDVLKAGHHGSKTSTGDEFLNVVAPNITLISVGQFNSFKHPSKEVIDKLNSFGTKILRTDLNKAVILNSDGNKVWQLDWL